MATETRYAISHDGFGWIVWVEDAWSNRGDRVVIDGAKYRPLYRYGDPRRFRWRWLAELKVQRLRSRDERSRRRDELVEKRKRDPEVIR